jgi:hypothetical protein
VGRKTDWWVGACGVFECGAVRLVSHYVKGETRPRNRSPEPRASPVLTMRPSILAAFSVFFEGVPGCSHSSTVGPVQKPLPCKASVLWRLT